MPKKPKLDRRKLNLGLLSLLVLALLILLCLLLPRCTGQTPEAVAPDNYIQPELGPEPTPLPQPETSPAPTAQPHRPGTSIPSGQGGLQWEEEAGTPGQSGGAEATIRLFSHIQSGSFQFDVYNMFPGDSIEKLYTIEVSHKGTVEVNFTTTLRNPTQEARVLAQGLHIQVTDLTRGRQLYDGALSNLPPSLGFVLDGQGEEICDTTEYRITAYLPTSAGNEYQNKSITVDLKWWVEEVEKNALSGWQIDPVTGRPRPLQTLLSMVGAPPTGDAFPVTLVVTLLAGSLAAILILLFMRRRDRNK